MDHRIVFVLGAADPEMAAIESLLGASGVEYVYATKDGVRVHPGNAYAADWVAPALEGRVTTFVFVECDVPALRACPTTPVVVVDHHRPGDRGFGRGPEDYLEASSIGQVVGLLAARANLPNEVRDGTGRSAWQVLQGWCVPAVPGTLVPPYASPGCDDPDWWAYTAHQTIVRVPLAVAMTAAADHCLLAAYQGRCPGIDPDALSRWRVESRANHQGRSVDEVLADIEAARERLRTAPRVAVYEDADDGHGGREVVSGLGAWPIADVRGCTRCGGHGGAIGGGSLDGPGEACHTGPYGTVPELPEAGCREGIPFLAFATDRDGRKKVVLQASPPHLVEQFLAGRIVADLVGYYGDPARGFAGGYLP